MEQNAPNHVIGTGSLQVKPDMQSVYDELARVEQRFKQIEEAGKNIASGMMSGLREVNTLLEQMASKIGEMKIPKPESREGVQDTQEVRRVGVPEANSPAAQRLLTDAVEERATQEQVEVLRSIEAKLDIVIQNQQNQNDE